MTRGEISQIFNIEKRRLVGEFDAMYAAEEGEGFVAEVLYRRYEQAFLYNASSLDWAGILARVAG